MIPRLKPYLSQEEFFAVLQHQENAVVRFEEDFARTFVAKQAIAFPYGRSALWTFFKALGIEQSEIIIPAYTCSVVAHAIVLSGNIPRFVDITLYDYNMDLNQVEKAINKQTRAIVATHLFGYPLNVDQLQAIVQAAEARYGHKIWVIQDCAHSFGARWQERLVCNEGDVSLFGLNISKLLTSIFGGMLTTNDLNVAEQLRQWRDAHFTHPDLLKSLRRRLYLLAVYPAFNEYLYGFVNWLQEKTPLLNRLTKAYHLDEKIHFPPDYLDQMLAVEAQVGLAQLRKYPEIVWQRQQNAAYYNDHLPEIPGWVLPPLVDGATYSHYVVRVPERMGVLEMSQKKGVQLGQLIEYSIPHMAPYRQYGDGQEFPNSWLCSRHMINLPVYANLHAAQRSKIVETLVTSEIGNRNHERVISRWK
jgi:dTDP-4-amino-4,6-dideoxygalactose transaminase